MTVLATCAGFRDDVLPEIRAHGPTVELADHLPFVELFGAGDRGLCALLVAAAVRLAGDAPLAVEEMFGPVCVDEPSVVARTLSASAVAALAAVDDLRLSALWNDAWQVLGRCGDEVPADVTQAIRGFVVQCRAAVANRWQVFVIEAR